MTVSAFRTLAVLVFASTLAACGGGGAGGGGALPSTPSSGTTTTPITPSVSDANVTELAASDGTISGTIRAGSRKAIVAVMSGAGDLGTSSPSFAQDSLAVNAAAITGTAQSAMRSSASAPQPAAPVEAFPADDARARRLLQRLTPSAGPAPMARAKQSISGAAVGSSASVWVEKSSLGSSSGVYQQVPATLEVQTAHGNIWIDNTLLSGSTASSAFASGALASTVAAIGSDFENAYASDTGHFATTQYSVNSPGLAPTYKACNADGSSAGSTKAYIAPPADGRINVMVVNPRSSFGSGMGGYFSSVNYMPQVALNCIGSSYRSNEAPFIYVGWFDNNGATYELKEDLVRGTAHELQHLINFVNHSLLASTGAYEETFINEGLSMLAQDLAVQHMYGSSVPYDAADAMRRAQAYLAAPQNFSVSGFIGIDAGSSSAQFNCGSGCYGSAYLFQRYLYDRLGGDAYANAMETSSLVGASNITHAASGESFSQVLDDFGLALATSTAGVTPKDPRYAFGLNLTASYADQMGGRTALTGVAALPMSGSAVQVQAPLGGFAFVNFGTIPAAGQSFTITDRATVGGFAPVGGLVQQ